MDNIKHLKCIKCGEKFAADGKINTCLSCGSEGILDVIYDYDLIRKVVSREGFKENRDYSMWRYQAFLPMQNGNRNKFLHVGWTPLYNSTNLAEILGLKRLYIKDDGLNPTASLKDRASAIAVAKALEEGTDTIACSSTGNAASSLAGNAAAAGLKSYIFVPQRAPEGKVAQLLIFGAKVIIVQGSYEDAFKLSEQAIAHWGWYNRNAALNPFLVEGKKTVSMEICEQLDWEVPDWVVVAVGDGCTIAGVWKGFKDLYHAGLINKLPRLAGVQAEGCSPISRSFFSGKPLVYMEENTIADSIAVSVPRNPQKALRAIRESRGTMINVTDQEILEAMKLLGHTCGIFGEPAGVAGLAGLKKLVGDQVIGKSELIVTCVTGNGLKDTRSAIKAVGEPPMISPNLEELKTILKIELEGES